MTAAKRDLYVAALGTLLRGDVAKVVRARNWELLREVARLAQSDAPHDLAVTDPALFQSWRAAVTRFHLAGWTNMSPERVDEVRGLKQRGGPLPSGRGLRHASTPPPAPPAPVPPSPRRT